MIIRLLHTCEERYSMTDVVIPDPTAWVKENPKIELEGVGEIEVRKADKDGTLYVGRDKEPRQVHINSDRVSLDGSVSVW